MNPWDESAQLPIEERWAMDSVASLHQLECPNCRGSGIVIGLWDYELPVVTQPGASNLLHADFPGAATPQQMFDYLHETHRMATGSTSTNITLNTVDILDTRWQLGRLQHTADSFPVSVYFHQFLSTISRAVPGTHHRGSSLAHCTCHISSAAQGCSLKRQWTSTTLMCLSQY